MLTIREAARRFKEKSLLLKAYYVLTVPVSIYFILDSKKIDPSYQMSTGTKLRLGSKMFFNTLRIPTGTSYKTHLAMALKLLETAPSVPGDVVECGTWKGGSAANLSLVCRVVGRRLRIYDSFEGLPEGRPDDREAKHYRQGEYRGSLEEVRANIAQYGALECCDFVPGWFDQTLPRLGSPVVLAFLDVDLEDSLVTCVRGIWPQLVEGGFIFIDEGVSTDYCSLFFSERWWQENYQIEPPGLIGAGIGLALGEFYIGPWSEANLHPLQHHNAGAYTSKGFSAHWTYYDR